MARKKRGDGPDGVLLVDKPEGPTSFDVIAKLRKALGTSALGHAGTLDPLASGLLIVLAGRYTRLSQHLTQDDKRYVARVVFGTRTTTDDREGEVVESGDPGGLTKELVVAALAAMEGPGSQVPPAFSAISVGGERLYAKARRGEEVEAPPRDIVLRELALLSFEGAGDPAPSATVDVLCSKGTYVRAIARDLGARLGVPAHLGGLRRTAAGAYRLEDATALDALLEPGAARAALRSGPEAIRGLDKVPLDDGASADLRQGRRVPAPAGSPVGQVLLAHRGEELIALVERQGEELRVVRGFGAAS